MFRIQHIVRACMLFCALSLSLTVSAQWAGSGSISGDIYRDGNVGIGYSSAPAFLVAKLDVRGDNIFLAPTGTTGFPTKFVGLGESGGDCNQYGLRVQRATRNFINVGVKQADGPIMKSEDIQYNPTISWGSQGYGPIPCPVGGNCIGLIDRPLLFEFDKNDEGCGEVVVGMYSPGGSYQFRIFGDGLVNSSFITSDARYKTNVQVLKSALNTIKNFRGVSYAFNKEQFPNMNLPEGRTNGFIAQEVKEFMPEIVGTDENGYHAINYDAVVPVLVEAVKEQNAIVEAQNQEIQDLRNEINEIKAMLAGNSSKMGNSGMGFPTEESPALFQNQPNPSNGYTNIPYFLPETVQFAQIRITSISGQEVDVINLNERGKGEVRIDSDSMEAGIYLYSLVVDGQRIDSKRMVISK